MKVWVIKVGEPLPIEDKAKHRLWRAGFIASSLAERNHEVVSWASTFNHSSKKVIADASLKINYGKYCYQLIKGCSYYRNIGLKRLLFNYQTAKEFARLASQYSKPDIIHVANVPIEICYEVSKYALYNNIPFVVDIRDLWPDIFLDIIPSKLKIIKPLAKLLLKPLYSKVKYIMTNATGITGITQPMMQWGVDIADKREKKYDRTFYMAYPKNSSISQNLNVNELLAKFGLKSDEYVCCYFGNIGYQSDFNTVVKAARILQNKNIPAKFLICGNGPLLEVLRKETSDLTNLILPGWLNSQEIVGVMRFSSVGLLPFIEKKNYTLNMPNKFAEYLSGSLAIACGLRGEMARMVERYKCGFVYPSGDAFSLADKLLRLVENREKLALCKSNAKKLFMDEFTVDKVYNSLCDYLEEIVSDFYETSKENK